jgi:hypothetical protein
MGRQGADVNIFNELDYNPYDESSDTGYKRPPRDPACVCDYFAALGQLDDEGRFAHCEMQTLLDHPSDFFGSRGGQ